jgi:hypothetical protein
VYAYEVHAREVHAREVHAREVHAHETLTNGGAVVICRDLSLPKPSFCAVRSCPSGPPQALVQHHP